MTGWPLGALRQAVQMRLKLPERKPFQLRVMPEWNLADRPAEPTPQQPELAQLTALAGPELVPASGVSDCSPALRDARSLASALRANLDWMASMLTGDQVSSDSLRLVDEATRVSCQLADLLEGALDRCDRNTGSQSTQVTATPLAPLLEAVVAASAERADQAGVLVSVDLEEGMIVEANASLLERALRLLLGQALDRSPRDGVIQLVASVVGRNAVIALSDEGDDLSPEELERLALFCAGAQTLGAPPTANSPLLECRPLLEAQGGFLDIENRTGGGSTTIAVLALADSRGYAGIELATVVIEPKAPGGSEQSSGRKWSGNMIVHSDRFGDLEIDAGDVLTFPNGLIGFPTERQFVLIRNTRSNVIAWLQSTQTSYLALPVVSAHALATRYPDVPVEQLAEAAGVGVDPDELAVVVVLSAPPSQPATVNLMAPIVVNASTRTGAQVLLEGTQFSTRELFALPAPSENEARPTPPSSELGSATSAAE